MSKDITKILDGWDFDPNQSSVRIVAGADGREKIQMRVDLGLLQMNFDGRPDGARPEGQDSWLDFYRQKQESHDAANPDATPFLLESGDCVRLLQEGMQYYQRYLSFWHLGRYELCARDTNRNLRLFAFVRDYARHDRDKLQFDQWRPYVIMMHTRAVATPLLELGDGQAALRAIDAGIAGIHKFLEDYSQTHRAGECGELLNLQRWREQLASQQTEPLGEAPSVEVPPSSQAQLNSELEKAILEERFEDAAGLRDRIRRLADDETKPPSAPEERL